MPGVGVGVGTWPGGRNAASSLAALYAAGAQGVWLDLQGTPGLFSDTGGTTPAVYGDGVALARDKSGRGNHFTQATPASRPTYGRHPKSGIRNLLLATDALATQAVTLAATAYTLSIMGTGSVTLSGAGAGTLNGTGAGNRVSLTFTPTAGAVTFTVSGSVTFAQLEAGGAATAYQKVTTAWDITEAGVADLRYLYATVDDAMATAAIDFSATDKITVFLGVRKMSDAAVGMLLEFSANKNLNSGSFYVTAPETSPLADFRFATRGDVNAAIVAASGTMASPTTKILTGIGDIANDNMTLRANGTQVGAAATDQGAGNFGNYPLYLFARSAASLFFTGYLYDLCIVGKAAAAAEIVAAETQMNAAVGAY